LLLNFYFEDVIKDKNWVKAMDEEMDSIEKNATCDLIDFSKREDCIGVKCVYKTRFNENGKKMRSLRLDL